MQETHNIGLDVPKFVPANFGAEPSPELVKKQRKPPTKWKPGERPVGRAKGTPNKVTQTLREAVELAARDCHPQGLAGWLVERANGGVQDRQIFAGLVGKVIPIQVNQAVSGGVSISLNWLGGRNIGTIQAQPKAIDAQTVELIEHSPAERWTTDAIGGGSAAPEPVAAAQAATGHPGTSGAATAPPAASEEPSRAIPAADPPPPYKSGSGG